MYYVKHKINVCKLIFYYYYLIVRYIIVTIKNFTKSLSIQLLTHKHALAVSLVITDFESL